jgi:hypothetical protein
MMMSLRPKSMAREYKEGYGVGNFQRLSKSALALWQPRPWNRRIIRARQSDISGEELKRSDMRIALAYQTRIGLLAKAR